MLLTVFIFALMTMAAGLVLGYISQRYKIEGDPVADKVEALLPQTRGGEGS